MERATPDIQSILTDAVVHHQAGRLNEAIELYRQALMLNPHYAGVHNNLGTALCDQGKLEEAETSYRLALQFGPGDPEALNNLGTVLQQQGKLDAAVASYNAALAISPDHAEAHANLGSAFFLLGKLDTALASYRSALAAKPDFAAALKDLGTVLWEQGKLDKAAAAFRQALKLQPHYTDALDRLAAVTLLQGHAAAALDIVWQSLQIGESQSSKKLFVDIVRKMRWTSSDSKIRTAMSRALTEPWAKPGELAQASADLLRQDAAIGACVARAAGAWPQRLSAPELFGAAQLAQFAADPLLDALLTSTQNTDIAMERFLTMARRLMLEDAAGAKEDTKTGLDFYSALARQCFINEYVFFPTDDEMRQAGALRDALEQALETGAPVPALRVIAVAAYFPLYTLVFANRLLDQSWPAPVAAILAQQISEPLEEARLRATIKPATAIQDAVSRTVRNQYEENPYPRWVRMPVAANAITVMEYLSRKFPFAPFRREGGGNQMLSAGCGTGQAAIELAMGIKTQLLAVDLSLSSLGYAMRKARELGLSDMEFAQADILELGAEDRRFDVIECSGVLHHMADPFAGWRGLLSLLRPGGFMLVALYSQMARRDIVRTRQLIAERDFGTSAEEIRRCRQDLLEERESLGVVTTSSDFFGTSTCRDLLFHSREVQMTLGEIAEFLRDNGLSFVGFEIEGDTLQAYRTRYADDPAAINLEQWQEFEQDNPGTFLGMYTFWVQKRA